MKLSQLSLLTFYLSGTVIASVIDFDYPEQQPLVDTNRVDVTATCPIPARPPHGKFWDNDNRAIEEVRAFSTKEQMFADPGEGTTVTVNSVPYLLKDDLSGESASRTYRAHPVGSPATIRYAKRPVYKTDPGGGFASEVKWTQQASNALGISLYYSTGVDPDFQFPWLITYAVPGNLLIGRWGANRALFRTRAQCEADLETAKRVISTKQRILAKDSRTKFIHDDSHPENWYVADKGSITNATPIDFGKVRSTAGMTDSAIDALIADTMNQQYKLKNEVWASLSSDCDLCHP